MQEFKEIHNWIKLNNKFPEDFNVSTLPSPDFISNGKQLISFSTNNYLGLSSDPAMIASAAEGLKKYGVGNCESRLLGGDLDVYRALENKLAEMKHKESALMLATGFLTNLGILSTLPKAAQICRAYGYRSKNTYNHMFFSDEFNHISIREGIRMSGCQKITYRHCDLNHLESYLKKYDDYVKIIVTDGVFSQDGDIAPLPEMVQLAEKYNAILYVDDAHGTGVLGTHGGGISEHFNCYSPNMIHMGTLSKAYGALGGFVATEKYVTDILKYTCSSYGFTSTIPPDQAYAIITAMDLIKNEPERRQKLWNNQAYFVERITRMGYQLLSTQTPIMPIHIGDEKICMELSALLHNEGIHIDAIMFPAVKMHSSRLRVMVNAMHTKEQIDKLLSILDSYKNKIIHSSVATEC